MAARLASRHFVRRFSSNGRILSEEEKAAENVYIKKVEREKLEKLAHKGSKPEENPTSPVPPTSDAKPGSKAGSSTNQNRNYAVIAGAIVAASAVGWYLLSKPKKTEEKSK
ncbi:hypothetical protein KSP40_PGU015355 [Platanthera guangdongensis]|uniref:Uncharacterized protein n=1 Tax=Platanthera guangdongensis TaxID=2320717 RepID=A0ABR2N3Y7_9ASPA